MPHITYLDEDHHLLSFFCPACDRPHKITVPPAPSPWSWNGNRDKPTISPSILVNPGGSCPAYPVCHSFITDGVIRYCGDSTHALAGKEANLQHW